MNIQLREKPTNWSVKEDIRISARTSPELIRQYNQHIQGLITFLKGASRSGPRGWKLTKQTMDYWVRQLDNDYNQDQADNR